MQRKPMKPVPIYQYQEEQTPMVNWSENVTDSLLESIISFTKQSKMVRCMSFPLVSKNWRRWRGPGTREQVVRILSRPVQEVVFDVTQSTIDTVVQSALLWSNTKASVVCFERAGPRVCLGYRIGIIRPNYKQTGSRTGVSEGISNDQDISHTMAKPSHEFWMWIKDISLIKYTSLFQLCGENPFCQGRLNYICSVKTSSIKRC